MIAVLKHIVLRYSVLIAILGCHDPTRPKIAFGEMRTSGVRDVLIYCRDHRSSHHVETSADGLADDVMLSDIEGKFTCTRCGKRGADVRRTYATALRAVWNHP